MSPTWIPRLLLSLVLMLPTALSALQSDDQETSAETPAETRQIYPHLAAGLIAGDVAVIDVRSAEEVEATGLLAGAVNIPHTRTEDLARFIGENAGRAMVLYCRSGRRVGIAIEALRELGYHGLVNAGGYDDLAAALENRN